MGEPVPNIEFSSFQNFLQWEAESELRHEYWNGTIQAMAGGSKAHNRIVSNIRRVLEDHFLPKGYQVFAENVKLEVIPDRYYTYPDIMVLCGEEADEMIGREPIILVEVLSASTEVVDRGKKLKHYQKLPSLRYYLIVSQREPTIEVYHRPGPLHIWQYQIMEGLEQVLPFPEDQFEIRLANIYAYVDWQGA
ncbi:MAG: Uma2 family endonuclease [Lewinella sp.]|nr:Uma2 family endonuclease [Lewinella sp.]